MSRRKRTRSQRRRSPRPSGSTPSRRSAPDAPSRRRARRTRLLIVLFFASGATSLVYETLWARQLHLVFGTTQLAISTLLAAFMAGLALGGFAAARWAERVARPLLAYAALEAFIGLYALVFPLLLKAAAPLYLALWRALEPGPLEFGAYQLGMLGLLLLPPTACMGATLPLLARFVTAHGKEDTGFEVGRLYGANTLGAVLGTAAAGFVLLPALGLFATTIWTAAANGGLALAAVALARGAAPLEPAAAAQASAPLSAGSEAAPSGPLPLLLAIAAMAGFASLLCEVSWFRLMVLMLGGSAYAFSIMLLAFLLGIGTGGWLGGRLCDRAWAAGRGARVLAQLAALQAGVAALSWAAMYAWGELPFAFVWLFGALGRDGIWLWISKLLLSLAIMTPPAVLMGASFPYLVRAAGGGSASLSRPVGLLYGANTLGAIAGAAGGALLLLPNLYVRGSVLAAVSVNLVCALAALTGSMRAGGGISAPKLAGAALATAAAVGLVHWQPPPWSPLLMSSGMYKYASDLEQFTRADVLDYAVKPFELRFYAEGLSSVVTVGVDPSDGNIWLANNGKVDASSLEDRETQVLLAHLPFLFRPQAERVLIIGLASGLTAGSVTLHAAPKQIDVAELEPAIVAASHEFDEVNYRPLEDPRVRVHLNDARNHLLLTEDGAYDLVTSEPSNPWLSGVSNLFTREFFALGKRKLSARGVWAQWLHGYGMTPDDLRSLLATFADVYPNVRVFRLDASDYVLIGSESPLPLGTAAFEAVMRSNERVRSDLAAIGANRAEDLLGLYSIGEQTIQRLTGGVELNTDDNMRIEYSAPLHLHTQTSDTNTAMLEAVAELPVEAVATPEGLGALATVYEAHDSSWRRTLAAAREAATRRPADESLAQLYATLRARAGAEGVTK